LEGDISIEELKETPEEYATNSVEQQFFYLLKSCLDSDEKKRFFFIEN